MRNNMKITAKQEQARPTLLPKLRFPEFREAKWVQKKLEEVAPLQRGFDLPSDLIRPGDIPIVYSNGIQQYHEVGMATAPGLVTGRSGTIGKLHFIEHGEYWPHNTSLWVTNFKGNAPRFVYYLYSSIGMSRFSSGSGVPTLNRNDVHAFNALIPNSTAEQQKIAECLSSLDELLAAQARKVAALKSHKKGLMQQLFPREGETQPRLRFSEFHIAGDWEPKTLVDACRMQAGKYIQAADIKALNAVGMFPCYGGNGLRGFTETYSHDGVYALIGRQGALCGNVKLASERFYATEHAVVATPKQGVEVLWLYYLLNLLNLNRFATGQAQPGLSVDVLEKVPVKIPSDEREQQSIASCLSSLDTLITAETQKHEALKTHKQGLMQHLFPSTEEVEA